MGKLKLYYLVPQSTYEQLKNCDEKETLEAQIASQPATVATKMKRVLKTLKSNGITWNEYGEVKNSPLPELNELNLFQMLLPAVRGTSHFNKAATQEDRNNFIIFLDYLREIGVSQYNLSEASGW